MTVEEVQLIAKGLAVAVGDIRDEKGFLTGFSRGVHLEQVDKRACRAVVDDSISPRISPKKWITKRVIREVKEQLTILYEANPPKVIRNEM